MISAQEFAQRRERLLRAIGEGSIAIIAAAKEQFRNADCDYPFRQNSDFYYLTGFHEPEAVAVFIPGRAQGQYVLFNRERDPEKEIWHGFRAGQTGACEIYGADQSFPIHQLDLEFPKMLEDYPRLYYAIGRDMAFNRRVLSWVNAVREKVRGDLDIPTSLYNIEDIIHRMRMIKSPAEIAVMRKAAEISAQAHCAAMKACRPGLYEYELEAEIQYTFTRQGSRAPAYNHIVGAGANSCTLHYNANNALIKEEDLVLIDAGAEFDYYAADITRTFPANGRFTEEQRAIYEVVLAAQLAVIALIKPHVAWDVLQEKSDYVITQSLMALGLLSGNFAELMARRAHRQFYMHKIGHWLGLDVHDVGIYERGGICATLEPGMVLTVEPGIYIPAGNKNIEEKWWNIGVRIEDDILVTEQGCEVLSAGVPKTVVEIEALMSTGRAG
jgi:Xaa-Pro aminopeptidase